MMRERARMIQGEMGQTGGISDFLPKPAEETYAKGGPIAFAARGLVPGETMAEQLQRLLAERDAAQYGEFGNTGWTPEEITKYPESGWTPEDITKYKSPGAIATKASIPSGPTINVPPGGFNAQTNYPAIYKPQGLAPIYQQKTGLPVTISQGASATPNVDTGSSIYKSGLPANPWDVASEGISLDKFKSVAKAVGSKALRGLGGIGAIYGIAETASEPSNIDKYIALRAAKGDKQAQAVLDKGGADPILSRTKTSVKELLATPEQAYEYVKSKMAPQAPDAYVGASERAAPKAPVVQPAPAVDKAELVKPQIGGADQRTMTDRMQVRPAQVGSAAPVMGGNAPTVGAGAPPTQQAQPQQQEERDQSLSDYMKQYREVTGENKGIATLQNRLSEREARLAKEEDRAPWMALMQAGLATMAGTSPNAMSNIGQGGVAGLQAYTRSMNKLEDAKDKSFEIQAKLEEAQRAEELAAAKYGLESVQADKKAKQVAQLEREKMAAQKAMNDADNAARLQVEQMQVGASKYAVDARNAAYGGTGKPTKLTDQQYYFNRVVEALEANPTWRPDLRHPDGSPNPIAIEAERKKTSTDRRMEGFMGDSMGTSMGSGMMSTQPDPRYRILSQQ
jgi:hypothetical protein